MEIPEIRNTVSRMFVLLIKSRRLPQRALEYNIKTVRFIAATMKIERLRCHEKCLGHYQQFKE